MDVTPGMQGLHAMPCARSGYCIDGFGRFLIIHARRYTAPGQKCLYIKI